MESFAKRSVPTKGTTNQRPPYVAWKAFLNFVESLALRVPVPNRVDRGLMASISGSMQSQLFSALKSLGLITGNGVTTDRLRALAVPDVAKRKKVMAEILKERYAYLFSLRIETATTEEVERALRRQGAVGDTVRKCLSFFLAAAAYAGIEVSPHLAPLPNKSYIHHKMERVRLPNIPEGMMRVPIFLGRPERYCVIEIPVDITPEEGKVILQTLPIWFPLFRE